MKSVKQNTVRQSIDQHEITLIESKQQFSTKQTEAGRAVQTTAMKRTDLARHRLLI